ncbi:MAG: aromatic amino acid transport family protein [archaeon]
MADSQARAIAILLGTIIGAGILGIPYVIYQAGFWTGILMIIALGIALLMLHLYLGEISLRTKKIHELTGYAEKYLGPWGMRVMFITMLIGSYGALTAYLIGVGATLKAVLGGTEIMYTIICFVLLSAIVYTGLKAVGKWELYLQGIILFIVLGITAYAFIFINPENLTGFSATSIFIPYGAIFFAMIGTTAIPEVRETLRKKPELMKKTILIGTIVPIIIYAIFTLVVVGVVGNGFNFLTANERIATVALGEVLGKSMNILANLFATFTMATSFLTIGLALTWVYRYDYKIKKHTAWALTIFLPLILALSGLTTFIKTIGIVGAVAGGIEGILIVMMHKKAKHLGDRKPEYSIKHYTILSYILMALFVVGIILTLI